MNVLEFFVFSLLILNCDNLFGVLCKPGDGDRKLSSDIKGSESEKKINLGSDSHTFDKKYLPKNPKTEMPSSSGAAGSDEAAKSGDREATTREADKTDSDEKNGTEMSERPTLYKMVDVELRNIDSNDFIISRSYGEIECYKFNPIAYRRIRSILFDGKIIYTKNKNTICQYFTIFNISGNNIHLVLSAHEGESMSNVSVSLSDIRINDNGSISFNTKYVGLFETLHELNKDKISEFYSYRDYKRVMVDINDCFDRLFFNYSSGRISTNPDIQDNAITTTTFEYEVFEPNEKEIFVRVSYDASIIWKSLEVGGYEFGTKKVEIFTINTVTINNGIREKSDSDSRADINRKTKGAANNIRTNASEGKTNGKLESGTGDKNSKNSHNTDKIDRNVIKLIQIMIKNNYYHYFMYNSREKRWDMLNKTEFDSLYANYKLDEIIELIKNDSNSGLNRPSEGDDDQGNIDLDCNHIIDISKRNSFFSYSFHNLLKYNVITMSINNNFKGTDEENKGTNSSPELPSDAGIENLGEKSGIFQINYGDQFFCHLFGTNFTISLVKSNDSTHYVEIVNVTNAKSIGDSSSTIVNNNNPYGSDTRSSTPKSSKSDSSEFSFINMNDDLIFSKYNFKKSRDGDKWEKIDPLHFIYLSMTNLSESEISGQYHFSECEIGRWTYIPDLPIQMKIKLNADSIPSDINLDELDCKSGNNEHTDKSSFQDGCVVTRGTNDSEEGDDTCTHSKDDNKGSSSSSSVRNKHANVYTDKVDIDTKIDRFFTSGILTAVLIGLMIQIIQ